MDKNKSISWYSVYQKIAIELQKFYNRHKARAGHELFKLLKNSQVYRTNNQWLSNMGRIKIPSIEPIQLFVSFNRSRQPEENRIVIINELWRLLTNSSRRWNHINFEGCPSPMALKLQYVRQESAQSQIWDVFNSIMQRGKDALSPSIWESVNGWRGIQIPSFTIFMYWVKSKDFLPLDKNTRKYLEFTGLLPPDYRITYDLYLSLLRDRRISDYIQVSIEAYYFNNFPDIFQERYQQKSLAQHKKIHDSNFKLVGLRTLGRNNEFHKILQPYKYYPIDQSIAVKDERKQISSDLETFYLSHNYGETLYNVKDLTVNITAIVGKNGSGKSSLLDLLLMGIYNLSIQVGYLQDDNYDVLKELNFELYWYTDTLYKMVFSDDVAVYKFEEKSENGTIVYSLKNRKLSYKNYKTQFFYSILINYSHYALNSSEQSIDWITPLSHKNDGYVTPIVINPKRTKGSIEINNEKRLLNMRLLLNLLELHDADAPKQSFRYIDNGKFLKYFSVAYDADKNGKVKNEVNERTYEDSKIGKWVISELFEVFSLPKHNMSVDLVYQKELNNYLVNKLFNIVDRYDRYKTKYKKSIDLLIERNIASTVESMDLEFEYALKERINELLNDIKRDNSHITLKFKQAVYYLKYKPLQRIIGTAISEPVELDKYHNVIMNIINAESEGYLIVAQLLPPAIFKLDFYLDDADKSSFSKSSSGEYQLISVLSSILYHIRNIDSIEDQVRYNYVTILLDEIELYFHPNMQRFFIKKLLDAISKLDSELYGVHILFATHSPFILSDILQKKILKLKNGHIESTENQYDTFAANIHDLLADEFFLEEGYMGAFAQREIEIVINLLNYIDASNELEKISKGINSRNKKERELLKQKFSNEIAWHGKVLTRLNYWKDNRKSEDFKPDNVRQYIYEIIEIIGEPLIKNKLRIMYNSTFPNDAQKSMESRFQAKELILQMMQKHDFKPSDLQ